MSPWWLRPPAEEGPAKKKTPEKPAARTKEEPKAAPKEGTSASEKPRSDRSRGPRRRRSPPKKSRSKASGAPRIAVFHDVEGSSEDLDVELILQSLTDRGRVIAKRAYGDWERFGEAKQRVESAGFEAVALPKTLQGKSSADIQLTVDALELCLSKEPCEAFAVISNDGGFHPLVAKLRETGVQVLGIGTREAVSPVLAEVCSEFLLLEDLARPEPPQPAVKEADEIDEAKRPVFAMLVETIESMEANSEGIIWGSALKKEMRQNRPDFDPTSLGYATFTDLLEDAERHKIIRLERDDRSGGYYVSGIAGQ